ncbi:hypothetical protein F320042A7_08710 [Blautia producta]
MFIWCCKKWWKMLKLGQKKRDEGMWNAKECGKAFAGSCVFVMYERLRREGCEGTGGGVYHRGGDKIQEQ